MLKSPFLTSEIRAKQYTAPSVFAFQKESASLESSGFRYEYQKLAAPKPENA